MNGKSWSEYGVDIPYDIMDFNQGIENYSNGIVLITEQGFWIGFQSLYLASLPS